jgi:hypothetical protein
MPVAERLVGAPAPAEPEPATLAQTTSERASDSSPRTTARMQRNLNLELDIVGSDGSEDLASEPAFDMASEPAFDQDDVLNLRDDDYYSASDYTEVGTLSLFPPPCA